MSSKISDKDVIKEGGSQIGVALKIVKELLLPNKKLIILSLLLIILIAATTSFHAWLIKPALDIVFIKKDKFWLTIIPIIIFFVALVKGFATYFQNYIMSCFNVRINVELRNRLYAHFIKSDLEQVNTRSSGEMLSIINNDVGLIVNFVNTIVNNFIKQSIIMFALVCVMFYQSVELSLISIIAFPVAIYPIARLSKRLRKLSHKNQDMLASYTSKMNETLQYTKVVKSYASEEFEINRMDNVTKDYVKLSEKIMKLALLSSPLVEMLAGIGISLAIYYGGIKVMSGETTTGAFFSFFAALMMAYKPTKSLTGMNASIQMGIAATERFYKIINQHPKIKDDKNAIDLKEIQGNIKMNNVFFGYKKDYIILNNINLDIKAGEKIALVGHSGGGKSTIMNLILRFYEPTQGEVYLDNINLKKIKINSLRKAISYVSQDIALFDDTILENIRYGKADATKEQVIKAARLANADEFINKLSNGYESRVGQGGLSLSGGQKQRISIARAFLYDAPILLLDEATSALDTISESLIKEAIEKLTKNKTTITIAHRLSTVMNADKIFVVSNGSIIESGTHKDLLEQNSIYANLYYKQFEN